jgi:hypothetical protein
MPELAEGNLSHIFPDDWIVSKYDDWAFFKKQFSGCCGGNKGVDFLAFDPSRILWLVELKDYRRQRRQKAISPWEEVALKVRDTLAGLLAAGVNDAHADFRFASEALKARKLCVAFHLEQPATHSKLFPRIYNLANVQLKLKIMIKPIDPHPRVVELNDFRLPWQGR